MANLKTQQSDPFYYAFDEKKTLMPHPTKLIVRFSGNQAKSDFRNDIRALSNVAAHQWPDDRTVILTSADSSAQAALLDSFFEADDVVSVHPIYTVGQHGLEVGITDEFLVQFLDDVSTADIDRLNEEHRVTVTKKDFYYLLRVSPKEDALEMANTYYETGLAKFSYPNFISSPELHQYIPNDTYFSDQWNFHNTGQTINDGHVGTPDADIKAPGAWDVTRGSDSITIAVLDEGVTSAHPDLPNTRQERLNGSNFADGNNDNPSPNGTHNNHGNACTGLIAATVKV